MAPEILELGEHPARLPARVKSPISRKSTLKSGKILTEFSHLDCKFLADSPQFSLSVLTEAPRGPHGMQAV